MSDEQATGQVLSRAMRLAPALKHGLRVTLVMAMIGQAITVVTPIVIQKIIDEEILASGGIDMS